MAADTSGDHGEPPRAWVEEFLANEDSLRRILDEVHEQHLLGEHETARERLRSLAAAEDEVFRVVALTALDADNFYDDLRAQYDDEPAPLDPLETFGERYRDLAPELELVFVESAHGYYNPDPSMTRRLRYSNALNMPRLSFDLYSGRSELCSFEHPPSQALGLAGLIVDGVAELLEQAAANDDDVSPTELARAESIVADLRDGVERVEEQLETADEAQSDGETDRRDDYDSYQDWGVY